MTNILTRKEFIGQDFLLQSEIAEQLYHEVASVLPIIDYHNHLLPQDIAQNKQYATITEVWLKGDHYKWRAMRTNGIDESYCTGNKSDVEKFIKWAETVPNTLRNPLYHWTHLELKRYFGIDRILDAKSARDIYEECNALLATENFRAQGLLKKMNVEILCTTDDPTDSLAYHKQMSNDKNLRMLPAFRPDRAYDFSQVKNYLKYVDQLSASCNKEINSLGSLLEVLAERIDYFDKNGCRLSDHGLNHIPYTPSTQSEVYLIYNEVLKGKELGVEKASKLQTYILRNLCEIYAHKGWIQQFHLGALRNNNSRMMGRSGRDIGFDSIGDFSQADAMSNFFDQLDKSSALARTIIYNLNPADNEVFATMIGNFNDGTIPGKMQWGPAWWFLDQKEGIEKQIDTLSNMGLLSRFVGMVTDSRSMLSFPRHEYFRRILCNLIAIDIENGEIPDQKQLVSNLISGICYHNAKQYISLA